MTWHTENAADNPGEGGAARANPANEDLRDYLDDERATALLHGGGIARIERASATTELVLPAEPSSEALLHPHLAITALVAGAWLGRRTFHAGSFVHSGCVWAVLGDRERGKSSTLAWLAAHDVPVFADDLLVLDGETALAGPRILDLRESAAAHFGLGRELGVVGTRPRWRIDLPDVAPELPFGGWICLEWARSGVAAEAIPAAARLERLVAARGIERAEPSSTEWLPIIGKPMVMLSRPQRWDALDAAMTALFDELAACAR